MTADTFIWFAAFVIVVILVMLVFLIRRFRGMQDTNARIEQNQRRAIELQERQTTAIERIAESLEKRG
ncbi:MAG: hypothetical protein HKO95_13475 [Rhodobacteraceae bacterium]|nr:hypothetical protein [Alphaproteobacteria bacterium]MBT8476510.1 hypothetical protein [Alphaproteobacteria bacterium]NNF71643.1 hypothetical protein [Paracoccaceae bacterium]NNK67733.1 hypothetical protein [Paracoccaceae bacterium]